MTRFKRPLDHFEAHLVVIGLIEHRSRLNLLRVGQYICGEDRYHEATHTNQSSHVGRRLKFDELQEFLHKSGLGECS